MVSTLTGIIGGGVAGSHAGQDGANAGSAGQNDITGPEERLAFALSDGRVGVLAVKGRKVQSTTIENPLSFGQPYHCQHAGSTA